MNFIDTHIHLDAEEYDIDREDVIKRAKSAGASHIFIPNVNLKGLEKIKMLCLQHAGFLFPMVGLHPEDVKGDFFTILDRMERELKEEYPFIAIGEVGLDFYWTRENEKEQLEAFERQVKWSIEYNLPLMIHCRKAQNEMINIMKSYKKDLCGGVFHCFTGNEKEADNFLQFDNFLLGIGGISTFKSSKLPEVLPHIPLNRIVLETDGPYMAPVPMRGKRNESSFIPYIIDKIAQSYNVSMDEIAQQTTNNVCKIFKIYI